MAITNHLIVNFNYKEIDDNFDFYLLTTIDKYISNGAYVIDKPIESLHAESVVFDNGRSLLIMFKKNIISRFKLINYLEDEKLTIKPINSADIKDYLLFKLFLYSINNFDSDSLKFNNITGKLYIVNPNWISKNRKSFKALNINVDNEMNIRAEASSFNSIFAFKDLKKIKDLPKYVFANKNNALKRVLHLDDKEDAYVRKALFGKKVEIEFFNLNPQKIKQTKVFYIYTVLSILENKYSKYFSYQLEEVEVNKSVHKIKDKDFMNKAFEDFNKRETNVISFVKESEYYDEFNSIVYNLSSVLSSKIHKADSVEINKNNIVYIHNRDYYTDSGYDDPYKNISRNSVIQCITIEDSSDKMIEDNNAIFDTVIKELVIKDDILNKKVITLDDWKSYGFQNDWIFGKEKGGKHYFLIINPNGELKFVSKLNDFESFNDETLDKCSDYLTDDEGKEKVIIADCNGNINIISRTQRFILPSKELFDMEFISRGKEARDKYLSGVVDINYYNFNDMGTYYNVGLIGSGMNTPLPKASLLYKIDTLKGENVVPFLLETMSVLFVKYKSFTVLPYPIKYLNEYIGMVGMDA